MSSQNAEAVKKAGTPARIEVIERYCKGCSICVEFCPTKVLEMDAFIVKVVKPEACIKCMQCELRCPDFAIKVHTE